MAPDCGGFLSKVTQTRRGSPEMPICLGYFLRCDLHTFQESVRLRIGRAGDVPMPSLSTFLCRDSAPRSYFLPFHLDASHYPRIGQHGFTADAHAAGRSVMVKSRALILYIQLINLQCTGTATPNFTCFDVFNESCRSAVEPLLSPTLRRGHLCLAVSSIIKRVFEFVNTGIDSFDSFLPYVPRLSLCCSRKY